MKNPYFDFFNKRSGQGDLDAKYELALIYEEEGESFDAFSLMYDLAQSNEERKIRTGGHKNGVYWDGYKRVKGMPKAKHRLAYYYENGIGTEVDIEKATTEKAGYFKGTLHAVNGVAETDIDVRLTRAKYENKKLTCRIRSLTCKDSCGYEVKSLSADYSMDSTQIKFDNLYLKDSYSTVNAKYLSFGYTKGRDVNDYVNKIVMGADFFNTTLDFRTVGVYAPSLIDNRLRFLIDGEVIGPVRDLRSNDLRVRTGDSTDVRVGVAITGLPKIQNTVFNFTFKDVNTTLPEVGMIVSSFSKSFNKSAFESLIPDIRLNVQGVAYGTLSDVYSMGKVSSRIGEVDYFAQTYPALDGNGRDISVEVGAKDLNAGKIIGSKNIGESSFSTAIHANITPTPEGRLINASLDSLLVHKLFINDYNFSGITAVGDIRNNVTNIRLISKNDALPLLFQGIVHMDEKFVKEYIFN